jgi:hypothetical protein
LDRPSLKRLLAENPAAREWLDRAFPATPIEEPWSCEHGREPPLYDQPTSWSCLDCGVGEPCWCASPRTQ